MKDYFTIGEAARKVNTTSETLRHYDRIGLVCPSKKDEWTKYRYYTNQDIVRLNTVRALQQMDLPLQEIKQILDYDDLQKIVDYLADAEVKADLKIAELQYSKSKIMLAKADYEKKLYGKEINNDTFIKEFPARTILLSSLEYPTVDNLWNYHRHFYDIIDQSIKEKFTFEDAAGIYNGDGQSNMFAICTNYEKIDGLKTLPAGKYLCCDCSEYDKEKRLAELMKLAREKYDVEPRFSIQMIVISGILKWNYQLQILISPTL